MNLISPYELKLNINATAAQTLSLLDRCSNMEELKQIHARMLKTRLVMDTILTSKLLTFCTSTNRGSLVYAKRVFDGFSLPNAFMWNAMIKGYSTSEMPEESLHLYIEMLSFSSLLHNGYTFPFVLKSCSQFQEGLKEIKQIHGHVFKLGFGSEIFASNSLIRAYARFGETKSAISVFERLQNRDIVSWNSIIDGLAKNGEVDMAFELFNKMDERNIISWTTMISCFIKEGLNEEGLKLFYEMQEGGIEPDNAALSSALRACAQLGALDQGAWIHGYIKRKDIKVDSILECVLIDMYSKCGDVESAIEVFLEVRGEASVETWTAMITGFGIHGRGAEAVELFKEMEKKGLKPNAVTFTSVLTACSHGGLVDEGRMVFERMDKAYGIRPAIEHYGCMVDLLSRAGLLNEAKEMINAMPVKPNASVLGSLMNACRVRGDLQLGKEMGEILVQLDPGHGGRYVDLASVYSAGGEWRKAVETRRKMKSNGVSKVRGCSAILGLDGVVHEFSAGDGFN